MQRIIRAWNIFKLSLSIINGNRKLLLFPLIAFLATLFLLALIVGGSIAMFATFGGNSTVEAVQNAQAANPTGVYVVSLAAFFVFYLLSAFAATFFNTAFCSEILKGMSGEDVSISRGFRFACSKVTTIFYWSLLAATVGLFLKMLEERLGWLGQLVVKLLGLVWAVATIFVVPVIVCRDIRNPVAIIKDSAGTIRKTWGETLTGFVGLSILVWVGTFAFILLCLGMLVCSFMAGSAIDSLALPMFGVFATGLLVLLLFGYLVSVTEKVYVMALYVYASEDRLVAGFDEELMTGCWKQKS